MLITTAEGCEVTETVVVQILPEAPTLQGAARYISCNGEPRSLFVQGADSYAWEPAVGLSSASIANPVASPAVSTIYTVTGANACGSDLLEVEVLVNAIAVEIAADTIACYREPFELTAFGADLYVWQPTSLVYGAEGNTTLAKIENRSVITVTGYDTLGCFASASHQVSLYPRAIVRAGNDRVIYFGNEVQLESFSVYPITWQYSPYLSCTDCNYPFASPEETTQFYAYITSPDGCNEIDSVEVAVHGVLYVPNAFTPDGDGLNDLFKAQGVDIVSFKMEIYNRWGELIFVSENINTGWNGACRGSDYYSEAGVYPYRIVAREAEGDYFEYTGHVSLVR